MSYRYYLQWASLMAWLLGSLLLPTVQGQTQLSAKVPLALREAEQLALEKDPVTRQLQEQAGAFSERAVADGQLPDPQLSIGIAEVPLTNFNIARNPDTELQLGISQSFPRGCTLRFKSEQTLAMARTDEARAENQRRTVLKALRIAYFELLYQVRAEQILEENTRLFTQLRDITERQYAAGRDVQHEVIRAQLELSLLEDKLADAVANKGMARAELAKWISDPEAERPLPAELPQLMPVPEPAALFVLLPQHPLMRAENALVDASEKSVAIAREQYKPGWMLSMMFADRTSGGFAENTSRDFLTAMVTLDLPLFREKRQDRNLVASQKEHMAAQFSRADRLRELRQMAEAGYASFQQLGKRLELYRSRATIEAVQTAEAAFNAYQNGVTDFTTLVRARMAVVDTQLGLSRVQVDRAKVQANLLYLAGEHP
jgi:outer membrane protein TolC